MSRRPALIAIVEAETKNVFAAVLQGLQAASEDEENDLATAFVLFSVRDAARRIAQSYHIDLQKWV